jgi:hypothetical protein
MTSWALQRGVRPMLCREGVAPTKKPRLPVLHTQGPSSARPPPGAHGDPLFSLQDEQCICDVPIIPPGAINYPSPAAHAHGGAAARRDANKTSKYGVGCYRFVSLMVKTHGSLGKPLMKPITNYGADATQQGNSPFTRDQFITGVLRELSLCLSRRSANLVAAVSGVLCACEQRNVLPALSATHGRG